MHDAIYRPILRGKDGEFEALVHLSPHARALTRPMLDIPPAKEGAALDSHLAATANKIAKTWGVREPLFIDLSLFGPEDVISDGRHAVAFFFDCARQLKLLCIPTTGPISLRGPGNSYTSAVAAILKRDRRGCAIRLPFNTFRDTNALGRSIVDALECNEVSPTEADLILDAGALEHLPEDEQQVSALVTTVREAVQIARQRPLRSVTFVGSNSLISVVRQSEHLEVVPRIELMVWRRLTEEASISGLMFGDYGVVPATQSDPDGPVNPPARVRLSGATHRYLFKSRRSDYRKLTEMAARANVFAGMPAVWGSSVIRNAAIGQTGIGNPTDWVARDTNLHIEQTVRLVEERMRERGTFQFLRVADEPRDAWLQSELPMP